MSDKELPNISVGDFAMDILQSMAKDPAKALRPALKESTLQSVNAPDVSHINVSEDYVSLVTEGKKPLVKRTPVIIEQKFNEQKLDNLIIKLSNLLVEAKQLIQEMSPGCTTVGNIGVNLAGKPKGKKNKKVVSESEDSDVNNPWAICHSSVSKNKTDKFERCVQKLKKKFKLH